MRAVRGKAAGGPHHRSPFFTAGTVSLLHADGTSMTKLRAWSLYWGVRLETGRLRTYNDSFGSA